MMGYKKYLFLIISLVSYFAFTSSVDAALCDREHISQLKELANQVEVNYEYIDYSEEILSGSDGTYTTNRYVITVNLISSAIYINYNDRNYTYDDAKGGIVTFGSNSGELNMSIHSSKCGQYKLRNITLDLPKFNTYYYKKECRGLENDVDVCDKWYQGALNDSLFYKKVNEYLESQKVEFSFWDKVVYFLRANYLIIIGGIILVVLVVVGIVFHRKRSVLE